MNKQLLIGLYLGNGYGSQDYRLIYRSWPSKPVESTFRIDGDKPVLIPIK